MRVIRSHSTMQHNIDKVVGKNIDFVVLRIGCFVATMARESSMLALDTFSIMCYMSLYVINKYIMVCIGQ